MSRKQTLENSRRGVEQLNADLESRGLAPVDKDTFCTLPFTHLSTTTDGEIRLCCRSRPVGHIKSDSIAELWSGQKMKEVRRDLSTGKKIPECVACWNLEKKGMVSLRNGQNIRRSGDAKEAIAAFFERGETLPPVNLEPKLSNMCNLRCRMCSPAASTQWFRDWNSVREYYTENERRPIDQAYTEQKAAREPVLNLFLRDEKFMSDLELFKDHITELEFAGGEPLIDPLHYDVLKLFLYKAKDVSLKYSTNLSVLKTNRYDVFDFWRHFKTVNATVSLDGFPRLNNYIRAGSKTEEVEKHIRVLKTIANVTLKTSTCVSSYNALYLAETFEYILGLGVPIYYNRVTYPRFMDARTLPIETRRRAIAKLRGFDFQKVESSGLDDGEKLRCRRVIEDCMEWLADESLAGVEGEDNYGTFLKYAATLDRVHGTSFAEPTLNISGEL